MREGTIMGGHVGRGTCIKVPVVVHRRSEGDGAERGGQRILVPERRPHHGLVLRRLLLLLVGVQLLGQKRLLLGVLLLWADTPLGQLGQRRRTGTRPHLDGAGPWVEERRPPAMPSSSAPFSDSSAVGHGGWPSLFFFCLGAAGRGGPLLVDADWRGE